MTKHNREDSQGYLERRKEGQLEHNWALLSLPKRDFRSLETTQCLNITENVSFKIASEASYIYILSGQKLTKNAKNVLF